MKVTELTGAALDWAVAKCEGITEGKDKAWYYDRRDAYNYSTNWAQGGPIIERERIEVRYRVGVSVRALIDGKHEQYGNTQLTAAMRCYVASKLGDEVEIPKELI